MLAQLNPFNYSLAEVQKALIALIFFAGYTAALFIVVQPGLVVAIAAIVPPAFGVAMVFVNGNHDLAAFNKAATALQYAVITVVNYFAVVPASTTNKIEIAVGALGGVVAVFWKSNARIDSPAARGAIAHRTQHRRGSWQADPARTKGPLV